MPACTTDVFRVQLRLNSNENCTSQQMNQIMAFQLVTILNITIFIVVISTLFLVPIETKKDPSLLSVQTAELGDNVTLHCAALQKGICNVYWYKQSLGFVPQTVASKVNDSVTVYPRFNSSFTVDKGFLAFNLKIRSITKDDEAIYFCQEGLSDSWSGTFVSVKGTFVSQTVVQQPVSASAQLGDPVALQCSITSQRTDHSNQCQGEPSVYWFRSGPSHPAAIYMNGNRSGECQNSSGRPSAPQSCVYTLPKNNVDSSDAGTYYCALAASCGEVVFGSGTKLDIKGHYIVLLISRILVVFIILPVGNDYGAGRSGTGRVNNGESVQKPLEKKYNK
uniref:Ig-like domain-containing protein n=1 Tax=Gadus morhua TaxID=8049 RepID=A0A8C5FCK9_GADMO